MADGASFVKLHVEEPGDQHARYEPAWRTSSLQLAEVVYPRERLPGDLCAAANTLTSENRPLGVLLLGNVSHPAGCTVEGRVLGSLELASGEGREQVLVAVAAGDPHFDDIDNISGLSELRRWQVELAFRQDGSGPSVSVRWEDASFARQILKDARRAHRLAQSEGRQRQPLEPAWKPLSRMAGAPLETESQTHTAAEHSFHALPLRFQKYVSAYLAHDERVLFALHRPAMRSRLHGNFLRGKRLEEAVFIVSTQQIAEVTELMPPDRAGIRYGFVARTGLPERLESVELQSLDHDVLGLHLIWHASGGPEQVLWEFPGAQRSALQQAVRLLRNWLPRPDDRRLRRATPPAAPEELPPLHDPAANDPQNTRRLAAHLQERLGAALAPNEAVLARCLLPAWIKGRDAPSLLAITPQRVLVVTEREADNKLGIDVPLQAISSFEFSSTLIRAYLKLFVPGATELQPFVIRFGKTLSAMNTCYLALRQATGVTTPLYQSTQS